MTTDVDFNFKTFSGYTAGGVRWATGFIKEPGSLAGLDTGDIRKAIERLSELVFYVGGGGVSDVYINGTTPNASGYTPTTPIKILGGQGVEVSVLAVAEISTSIPMTGTQPVTTDAVANTVFPTNIPKSWGHIDTDGVGGFTIRDGFNLDSAAIASDGITLTWASPFSSAFYAVTATANAGILAVIVCGAVVINATTTKIYFYDVLAGAPVDPTGALVSFSFNAMGRQ